MLIKGIEEIPVEEVRKVCQESVDTLERVSAEASVLSDSVFTLEQLTESIS